MKGLNFTELEKQVLRNFIPTQNVDDAGENVKNINHISIDIFENEREMVLPSTIKGVLGSLCKKGVLYVEDHEDNGFNWVYLNALTQTEVDEIMELVKR
jgi:predicted transcriptional regulator